MRTSIFATLVAFSGMMFSQIACASVYSTHSIYSGSSQAEVPLKEVASQLKPGGVAIVSEQHDFVPHHDNQVSFLSALAEVGSGPISVGLEFLSRPFQSSVDEYVAGRLAEPEFLKAVEWGGNNFDNYRRQVLFPRDHAGQTLALNASRALTSRIAKVGISGLTRWEIRQLPPFFELGNAGYRERFSETMQDHVPADALQRYFEAQSTWDDTMAWTASEFLKAHPEQRLVIIVGDFHAAYGGGLPDRLKARGVSQVLVISQVNLSGMSSSEEDETVRPSPKWGPRADFVWVER